ncbi:hypothetical protein [Streptomyces pyxinae]|uniref:hypothetical protein n=1 Tax=Streptomyces pyxinae TaxID=2970734 RepID=UPI0028682D21|nr:hypothetical protein [Streptomyces sp. LP05-1]
MSLDEDTRMVVHLDLRTGAAGLATAPALRARVAEALGRADLPEPEEPLFLVVDTPAGLTDHQRQYELLTGYRATERVRLLVLLVGSAPGAFAGPSENYQPDRRLLRPATLRGDGIALLWAGELRAARTALERTAPDDPEALAALVDALSVPDVFLEVLERFQALPEGVAAPGVRLLAQDLPPEVRDRAWRDALARFAGRDSDLTAELPATAWSAADLPEPLRALVAGRGGRDRDHRQPGGVADAAHGECAEAVEDMADALAALRTLPGLLGPVRREVLEERTERARQALEEYRDLVRTALRGSGGDQPAGAESAARLTALGLRVPSAEGVGERIGEGLRDFADLLLRQGMSLRAMAARFTGLAGRVEPVPGSALLPRLARLRVPGAPAGNGPAARVPGAAAALPAAAGAGLLGGVWQGPLALCALVVPLLLLGATLLGGARLRGAGHPVSMPLGPVPAAVCGAAAGVALAYAAGPPVWAGCAGLLLGLVVAVETERRLWRSAADSWAAGHDPAPLRAALRELDALLAEAVREHWAAEERLYCADAARSVAGMLRATASAADAGAVPEPERPAVPDGLYGAGPTAGDDWLTGASALETGEFLFAGGTGDGGGGGARRDGDDAWARDYSWDDPRPGSTDDGPRHGPGPGYGTEPGYGAGRPYGTGAGTGYGTAPGYGTGGGQDPVSGPGTGSGAATGPGSGYGGRPESGTGPRWLVREPGEGGPELVATLVGDLADAALRAMRDYWGSVERGQAGTLAVQRTEARVRELLATARGHLRAHGVLVPPPFAAPRRVRPGAAALLGTDQNRVARLISAEAGPRAVVQLSSPDQTTLLNRDRDAAVWVRFAPEAVQEEVEKVWKAEGTVPPPEVRWTSSGRYAGLIRLAPLRMGVVHTVRPRQEPDRDPTDHRDDTGEPGQPAFPYEGRSNPYEGRANPYDGPAGPYDGSPSYGDRPYDRDAYEGGAYEGGPYGDRPYNSAAYDGSSYSGDRPDAGSLNDVSYDGGSRNSVPRDGGSHSDGRYGDGPPDSGRYDDGSSNSFEYGGGSRGGGTHDGGSHGGDAYGRGPYDNRPYDDGPYDNRPYDNGPYDSETHNDRPYEGGSRAGRRRHNDRRPDGGDDGDGDGPDSGPYDTGGRRDTGPRGTGRPGTHAPGTDPYDGGDPYGRSGRTDGDPW